MLKALYFVERGNDQIEMKRPGKFGSLQVRATFYSGKLSVQVISGRDLVPMDEPSKIWEICRKLSTPSSDPRVEIEIIVDGRLGQQKSQKTKTQKETLNPKFDETFHFVLDKDTSVSPYSVIRFTVKDVDVLSRNDFMGEAFIPLSRIPGITTEKPLAQPMNLQLCSTDQSEKNPFLLVLKSRIWESDSQQFVASQYSRSVDMKKS